MGVPSLEDMTRAYKREKEAREILENDIDKKARALYLSQKYFANLFDSMKSGMVTFSKEGILTNSNLFFKNFFSEDLINSSPEFRKLFRETNTRGRGEPQFSEFEMGKDVELVLLNRDETSVSCGFTQIKNPLTSSVEIAVVVTDLTSSKVVAREKAEMQNKLIEGAYRDGVAENAVAILHNIGNVLTAIIGRSDNNLNLNGLLEVNNTLAEIDLEQVDLLDLIGAIKEELSDIKDGLRKDFEFVKDKSNHIAEVIAAQQRYANLKQEIKSKIVVKDLIDDCLLMHEDKILKEHIKIFRNEGLEEIFIEKNGMAQTISNVIVNACESIQERVSASGINNGEISISCEEKEESIIVKVCDNGMGLAKEISHKIFEYGYSTKERESGFGLHNCANFLKRSGGNIEIRNNEGDGATAILTIPKSKGE